MLRSRRWVAPIPPGDEQAHGSGEAHGDGPPPLGAAPPRSPPRRSVPGTLLPPAACRCRAADPSRALLPTRRPPSDRRGVVTAPRPAEALPDLARRQPISRCGAAAPRRACRRSARCRRSSGS
jgi:hypothetical protein